MRAARIGLRAMTLLLWMVLSMGCDIGFKVIAIDPAKSSDANPYAEALLKSADLILQTDETSIVPEGETILGLKNRPVSGLSDFLLRRGEPSLGSLVNGWIHILPISNETYFSSVLGDQIYLQAPSIVAVIDQSSLGDFISINPDNRQNGAFQVGGGLNSLKASYLSSSSDYEESVISRPAGAKLVVAASFGAEGTQTLFSVNGALAGDPLVVGNPSAPLPSYQLIQLGSSTATEPFRFKRLYIFARPLSALELGAMIKYAADAESMTVSLDPKLTYMPPPTDSVSNPLFTASRNILINRCLNCHSAWANASQDYFITNGLISAGNPTGSKLYYRLSGSSGGNGPKNMPQGGSIPSSEVQTIADWITQIN